MLCLILRQTVLTITMLPVRMIIRALLVVKGRMEGLHCFGDTQLTILLPLLKTLILTALSAYELNGSKPLFILSVYLPSSSHTTEEYQECFDLLWSLCDSLSVDGYPIVLADLNGDLGNSLREKRTKEPNERGR